jgi:hypothetical protein
MTTKNKHTELYIFGLITPAYYEKGGFNLHEKKIGVSGKGDATTLDRLKSLQHRQQPFQKMCHKRWKFTDIDALVVEKHLHKMFRLEGRESPRGDKSTEWWSDPDDNLIEIVESQVSLLQKLGHKVEELSAAETDEGVPSPTDAAKTRVGAELKRVGLTGLFAPLTQDGEFEKHFDHDKPYKAKELAEIIEKAHPEWVANKKNNSNTGLNQVSAEISSVYYNKPDYWNEHLGQKIIIQKGPWSMTFKRN